MRTIFLTMSLALLLVGCDDNKKTADVSKTKDICSSTTDYETGLASGLKVAPPCDITNNGTYKDKCVGEHSSTTWTNCFGERTLPNGEKYRGGYLEGKANGKGEFINADGSRYLGSYDKGKRNGAGKEYDANGKVIKVGEWSNGVFSSSSQDLNNQTVNSPSNKSTSNEVQAGGSDLIPQIKHLGACSGYHYSFALAAKNSNKMIGFNNSWNIAENLDAKYSKNSDYDGAKSRVMNHIASLVQNNDPNLSTALISYSNSCTQNGIATGQWN